MKRKNYTVLMTQEEYKTLIKAELCLDILEKFLKDADKTFFTRTELLTVIGREDSDDREDN